MVMLSDHAHLQKHAPFNINKSMVSSTKVCFFCSLFKCNQGILKHIKRIFHGLQILFSHKLVPPHECSLFEEDVHFFLNIINLRFHIFPDSVMPFWFLWNEKHRKVATLIILMNHRNEKIEIDKGTSHFIGTSCYIATLIMLEILQNLYGTSHFIGTSSSSSSCSIYRTSKRHSDSEKLASPSSW